MILFAWRFALLFILGAMYRAFQTPLERLTSLDVGPQEQAMPDSNEAAIAQARLQVQGPAIGLLVLGILQLLTVPAIFAAILYIGMRVGHEDLTAILAIVFPGLILVVGSLTIVAALEDEAA